MTYNKYTKISVVINDLRATTKKLEKIAILEEARDVGIPFIAEVFETAYNQFKRFGIKQVPTPSTENNNPTEFSWKRILKFSELLANRTVTGDKAKRKLEQEINLMPLSEREIAVCMIKKDMRCGATASTANKVWPGLVPVWKIAKCEKATKELAADIPMPAYAQEKIDALRCVAIIKDGRVSYLTSNGNPMQLHKFHDTELLNISNNSNVMIDGELRYMNEAMTEFLPRKTSNGIASKAQRGSMSLEEAQRGRFVVWDTVPLADFFKGICTIPYEKRFNWTTNRVKQLNTQTVILAPTRIVESLYQAREFFNEIVEQKGEGIILKSMDSIWEGKKLKTWLKFKLVRDSDLVILGIEEGVKGKENEGKLGAFICGTSDGKIVVNVGGGFSKEQRVEYFTNDMIGKIITAEFNEVIDSESRGPNEPKKLYLPVFIEVRTDKDVADTYEQVLAEKGMKIWNEVMA